MEELSKLRFELSESLELEIVNGLVVPKGSKVFVGLSKVNLPSNEEALKMFKQLFGIRKRAKIVEEEESVSPKIDDSSSEESEVFDEEEVTEEEKDSEEED